MQKHHEIMHNIVDSFFFDHKNKLIIWFIINIMFK